ncbi:hypothetical protein [uncultured Allomuricauda sp.]|uniref:hypothetical protein n=1 Tax=Flagellimonas sp. W118 TaxID=3410791 RepID=UPI00260E8872|nr:hypothetical protein [uncultured Allomuricauda sp.]
MRDSKKIYNFIPENERGVEIVRNRNNSFWIKEIAQIIIDLPKFQSEYDRITLKLDENLELNLIKLKSQRDLSIHYDKEPIKVIKMLSSIDIEETFKIMNPFLQILNEMHSLTFELVKGYKEQFQ